MRVALVASLVSPLRAAEANGPHAVIVDLAKGLSARGHHVTIYAAAGSVADGVDVCQIPVEPAAAAASLRLGGAAATGTATAAARSASDALDRGFARLFERLRRDRPDAVSQHAYDAVAIELAETLPVLHTLHLAPVGEAVLNAARSTRAPLATVSNAARSAWRHAGVADLAVLRNGVPDRGTIDGTLAPVALIAGRISPEKGTDIAVRAARRAGLAPLVVGDAYDTEYFTQEVQPLLRPREWIGPVPRAELSALMARCAVLLMPVRWDEAFGLVAAEAQMAGCPVVAFRRGALPEVVEHGSGGWLVAPEEEDALAPAIFAARALDRAAIRRRAQRKLGTDRMVDAYERALTDVAAHARERPRAALRLTWPDAHQGGTSGDSFAVVRGAHARDIAPT
jgi:glycosyltransferase involved in cell wall biosynthesis